MGYHGKKLYYTSITTPGHDGGGPFCSPPPVFFRPRPCLLSMCDKWCVFCCGHCPSFSLSDVLFYGLDGHCHVLRPRPAPIFFNNFFSCLIEWVSHGPLSGCPHGCHKRRPPGNVQFNFLSSPIAMAESARPIRPLSSFFC